MSMVRVVDPPARLPESHTAARGWIDLMAPAAELARAVASTDFIPRALRNNPAAITAAILYGDEIGLGPMQALAKVAVIEGRPFIAAEAQRALVYAAGHEMWIEQSSSTRVIWCGRRAGSDQIARVEWSMEDARKAKLDGKPNWRAYPRQMLSARASAELVRAVFPDVIGGLAAIEEADDVAAVDAAAPVHEVAAPARARRQRKVAAAPPDTEATRPPVANVTPMPPLPGELAGAQHIAPEPAESSPDDEPLSRTQLNRLQSLCRSRGIGDRADRITLASEVIGRSIDSSKDLTMREADRFIDYLEQLPAREDDDEQQGFDV